MKVFGAKRHPRDHHEGKGPTQTRDWTIPRRPLDVKMVVRDQCRPMERTPDHEIPRCAVPQSAEQHRDHNVDVAPDRTVTVATEWDIKIVAKKSRQRHI